MTIISSTLFFKIHKRYMVTQEDIRPQVQTPPKQDEIILDPLPEQEIKPVQPRLGSQESMEELYDWYDKLKPGHKHKLQHRIKTLEEDQKNLDKPFENISGNQTLPQEPIQSFYQEPLLTRVALYTDIAFKTFVNNIQTIADRFGWQVKQSMELAQEWTAHIIALDKYIKSLSTLKKTLAISLALVTVTSMLWKMGMLRSIPQFLGNLITIIPTPNINTSAKAASQIPSHEASSHLIQDIYDAITAHPLTPIVTGVAVGTIWSSFKIMQFAATIVKKIPK